MIDAFSIIFSIFMVFVVVINSAILDKKYIWFGKSSDKNRGD